MTTSWASFLVRTSFYNINAKDRKGFFDTNSTRFRWVFIRDMKVNYDSIKGFNSASFPRIVRFFDSNGTIFRWVFIRDMHFNQDNIMGFFFSSNFFLQHQCQGLEGFLTQIGPYFVGFSPGICILTMTTSWASFLVQISFYNINAKDWKVF